VSNTSIIVWAVVIGAVFGYLWWQGQLARFVTYVQETRVELEKCSWPTWEELKGSTALIFVSIALLGVFTVVVDLVLSKTMFSPLALIAVIGGGYAVWRMFQFGGNKY